MDVTSERFATDVVTASQTVPIVVDFWAPWCGPCRVMTPVMEKLEREANGKWRLVKVNTDAEPELARLFDIRGIPAFKMFRNGKIVSELLGAVPEPQVRRWLDDNIPSEARLRLDAAKTAAAHGDKDAAKRLFDQVLTEEPQNPDARVGLAE